MEKYLLDASVTADFFRPKSAWSTYSGPYKAYRKLYSKLLSETLNKKSIIFIPSFCIAEVKNTGSSPNVVA